MILYCVRHGESISNAEGRVQGQSDVELSDLGRRQGEAIARALAGRPIAVVYSSPLRRALETARILGRRIGVEVRVDPRLREIHAGIFQDKRRSEINRLYPEAIARWISEDPDYVIPGGESRNQLRQRGLAAFASIFASHDQQAVVVAHGRLLVTTIKALLDIPPKAPPHSLQNGSITALSSEDGKVQLVALDQIDHLYDVGVSGKGDL
jgi:broad specificity phosphatase PhoE